MNCGTNQTSFCCVSDLECLGMALIQISRRLPILRYLSPLARNPGEFVLGIHTSNPTHSGNVSSADKGSASDVKEEPGTAKANNPAASPAAASPAKEGEVQESQTSTSQPFPVVDDEWTEVVHSSGQVYYWNQRTGKMPPTIEPSQFAYHRRPDLCWQAPCAACLYLVCTLS